MLAEVELEAYLKEKRTAYRDYGDFTENEIDFISSTRSAGGIQRLPALTPRLEVCARRARQRIQALGRRLMKDATWLDEPVP
ncbi:hypothetical protein ACTMU2_13415 [Cupriavidus basilensis]